MRPFLAAVIVAGCALVSGQATAQTSYADPGGVVEAAAGGGEQEFGTVADIVYTALGQNFELFQGVEGPVNSTTAGRVCQSGNCGWLAGLQLPTGAQIRRIELSACDTSATQEVQFILFSAPRVPAGPTPLIGIGTGVAATPGCNTFAVDLPAPHTVQNGTSVYVLDVLENPGTMNWNQVRVIYRLQVSPAPGLASFADVPTTHPAFRFVEALAASGITGGCGGGNYCPDAPLTRSQMAIFLATALGLHFPN